MTNNDENCNVFGENKKIDNLIVTDMDLGLADNSNDFWNFLTLSLLKFCHFVSWVKMLNFR